MKNIKPKKILIICSNEKSKKNVIFDLIEYLSSQKKDKYFFFVKDRDKKILKLLKKKKKKL